MRRREAFDLLADELGVKFPKIPPAWVTTMMDSLGDTLGRSHRLSNAKFRQASGWVPKIPSLREGWKQLVKELAAQPA